MDVFRRIMMQNSRGFPHPMSVVSWNFVGTHHYPNLNFSISVSEHWKTHAFICICEFSRWDHPLDWLLAGWFQPSILSLFLAIKGIHLSPLLVVNRRNDSRRDNILTPCGASATPGGYLDLHQRFCWVTCVRLIRPGLCWHGWSHHPSRPRPDHPPYPKVPLLALVPPSCPWWLALAGTNSLVQDSDSASRSRCGPVLASLALEVA